MSCKLLEHFRMTDNDLDLYLFVKRPRDDNWSDGLKNIHWYDIYLDL